MKVLFQESCISLNAELLKWVWQSTLLAQTHMALGFHLVFGKFSHCPCWVIHAAIRAAGCELFEPKGGSGWILATKSSEEGWTCCICESLPLVVNMNGTSNLGNPACSMRSQIQLCHEGSHSHLHVVLFCVRRPTVFFSGKIVLRLWNCESQRILELGSYKHFTILVGPSSTQPTSRILLTWTQVQPRLYDGAAVRPGVVALEQRPPSGRWPRHSGEADFQPRHLGVSPLQTL